MSNLFTTQFHNTDSEAVPPYGVMQIVSPGTNEKKGAFVDVKKPDGDGKQYLVNGPVKCPPGKTGNAASRYPCVALFDKTDPDDSNSAVSVTVDDEWGPKDDSWRLHKDGTGFYIAGGERAGSVTNQGTVLVTRTGGGGGGEARVVGVLAHVIDPLPAAERDFFSQLPAVVQGVANDNSENPIPSTSVCEVMRGESCQKLLLIRHEDILYAVPTDGTTLAFNPSGDGVAADKLMMYREISGRSIGEDGSTEADFGLVDFVRCSEPSL